MPSEQKDRDATKKVKEHRDFPRLPVDAKVRIAGTATDQDSHDQPGELSDLSLGGARLSTPAKLRTGDEVGVVPFAALENDHPLKKSLDFQVMWCDADDESNWYQYGLAHKGTVLDVLHSWLGHMLLRQKEDSHLLQQRRSNRRLQFDSTIAKQIVTAKLSHDSQSFHLTLLDVAPGGLLAEADNSEIQVGMHLELQVDLGDPPLFSEPLTGCVVDSHSQLQSTFYRIAFDPESELDHQVLIRWADLVDGKIADS